MKVLRQLLLISWRNVFRNKRRTTLTLTILILGSTGLILVGGFLNGLDVSYREQMIHSLTGHLQVDLQGYFSRGASNPYDFLIKNSGEIQRQIELNPHVLFTVPRLKFSGMATSPSTSVAVLVLGADALGESRMARHKYSIGKGSTTHIVAGQDLDPSDPYGVVVGRGLKDALGLKIGDHFNLLVTRQAGAIDGGEFYVRGAFETIVKDFDDHGLKMNLGSAQLLYGLTTEIHSLLVVLDDTENTLETQRDLQRSFREAGQPLETLTWEEQGEFYRHGKQLLYKIYHTVQLIIAVVFFFSIANTINMALFERMKEFGTMMAMGNGRSAVFGVIFLEAGMLGLMGATLGIGVGWGVAGMLSSVGIEMPPLPGSSSGYYATILPSARMLGHVFLLGFFSTVLAALVPAYRASRFRIVQALGYV